MLPVSRDSIQPAPSSLTGHLEEIDRCDIYPMGYFLTMGGWLRAVDTSAYFFFSIYLLNTSTADCVSGPILLQILYLLFFLLLVKVLSGITQGIAFESMLG